MMFLCYSAALAILAFTYEYPDASLLLAMIYLARFVGR